MSETYLLYLKMENNIIVVQILCFHILANLGDWLSTRVGNLKLSNLYILTLSNVFPHKLLPKKRKKVKEKNT